jgi:SAM-dependent methyltransferase
LKAVDRDVWQRAQSGHLETWIGFARSGKERPPERVALWQTILSEVAARAPFRPSERMLDIGCGLDSALDFIGGAVAFTYDSLMAQLSPLGLDRSLRPTAGMLEALPYRDASFDRVFLMNVLDHVQDAERGLREIARVLRPGGQLVLSVDTFQGRRYHAKRLHKWWARTRGARTKHPWVFSPDSVVRLLRRVGLDPSEPAQIPGDKAKRRFYTALRR